jgi:hypothetical protein
MNDLKTTEIGLKERAHRLALVYQIVLSWEIPEEKPSIPNQEEQTPEKTEPAADTASSVNLEANPQEEGEFTLKQYNTCSTETIQTAILDILAEYEPRIIQNSEKGEFNV